MLRLQSLRQISRSTQFVVSDDHDWRFVYYLLRYESRRIQGMCSGVAVPIINKRDFEKVEINVPNNLKMEKYIASILSAYDDLIENNRRRIHLLETSRTTTLQRMVHPPPLPRPRIC